MVAILEFKKLQNFKYQKVSTTIKVYEKDFSENFKKRMDKNCFRFLETTSIQFKRKEIVSGLRNIFVISNCSQTFILRQFHS